MVIAAAVIVIAFFYIATLNGFQRFVSALFSAIGTALGYLAILLFALGIPLTDYLVMPAAPLSTHSLLGTARSGSCGAAEKASGCCSERAMTTVKLTIQGARRSHCCHPNSLSRCPRSEVCCRVPSGSRRPLAWQRSARNRGRVGALAPERRASTCRSLSSNNRNCSTPRIRCAKQVIWLESQSRPEVLA